MRPQVTIIKIVLHFLLQLTTVRLCAKFEVSTFNRFLDIRVPQFQ